MGTNGPGHEVVVVEVEVAVEGWWPEAGVQGKRSRGSLGSGPGQVSAWRIGTSSGSGESKT